MRTRKRKQKEEKKASNGNGKGKNLYTKLRNGGVGAGDASRYDSGSTKMSWLRIRLRNIGYEHRDIISLS
jgi:hypothetical protein